MPNQDEKEQAEDLISGLMKRIAGDGEDKKSSSSFPVAMVLLGIVVLIISFMGIKLAWAKRKAAELAVQVRRAEEEKKRAKEDLELANNSAEREAAQGEIEALTVEVLELKKEIADRQVQHTKDMKQLEGVTSWDDVIVVDSSGRWDG